MHMQPDFEKCLPFIGSEVWPVPTLPAFHKTEEHRLAMTISRQSGSSAQYVATSLAQYIQTRMPPDSGGWTVYDRNLVEKVLADHNLSPRIARFMPEDRVMDLADALDEFLGAHPPFWTLVQQTADTILRLARAGNVILVGRGAHVITSKLSHVFHVRLVGSLEKRVERMQELRGIDKNEALKLVRREDRGSRRYLKAYYGRDLDDPLSYHLVVNTDSLPSERAARLIGDAAVEYLSSLQEHANEGP